MKGVSNCALYQVERGDCIHGAFISLLSVWVVPVLSMCRETNWHFKAVFPPLNIDAPSREK